MTIAGLTCPIDGLVLGAIVTVTRGVDPPKTRGEHLHVEVDDILTCLSGHSWHITAGFLMERTA